jgi:hypothetical protein
MTTPVKGGNRKRITPFVALVLMTERRNLTNRLETLLQREKLDIGASVRIYRLDRLVTWAERRLRERQALWADACRRVMPRSRQEQRRK